MLAPSATSACAVLAFAIGNATEIFACMSDGSSPASRIAANTDEQPEVGDQHAPDAERGGPRMSSTANTIPSWP